MKKMNWENAYENAFIDETLASHQTVIRLSVKCNFMFKLNASIICTIFEAQKVLQLGYQTSLFNDFSEKTFSFTPFISLP